MEKMALVFSKKRIRIMTFVILDIIALIICSYLALALRFDFNVPSIYFDAFISYILIDIILLIMVFILYRLYLSIWSYASITELISIVLGCISYIALEFSYKMFFNISMPRSYYLIKYILLVVFISAIRYAYRIARTLKNSQNVRDRHINTMIIGAGEAGRLLIYEIYNNQNNYDNKVVCVIDDNLNKMESIKLY